VQENGAEFPDFGSDVKRIIHENFLLPGIFPFHARTDDRFERAGSSRFPPMKAPFPKDAFFFSKQMDDCEMASLT